MLSNLQSALGQIDLLLVAGRGPGLQTPCDCIVRASVCRNDASSMPARLPGTTGSECVHRGLQPSGNYLQASKAKEVHLVLGTAPHPVTVYIRGPIKGYIYPCYTYYPTVTEGGQHSNLVVGPGDAQALR